MTWAGTSFTLGKAKEVLTGIERRNWKLLIVMVVASGFFRSFWLSGSLALGGAISVANFWGLRVIIERALATRPRFLLTLFLKFLGLLGLLFLLIVYGNVHKVAFVVGLSVAFLSVTWEGFKGYLTAKSPG